jgi:signal transduction histidine kinase
MMMDLDLALDIFWIELCHIAALLISLYFNGIILKRAEKSPLRNRYLAVQLCLLLWIISKILKTISPNADLRWFFIVTQYFGVSFLGSCLFFFSHRTVKNRDPHVIIVGLLILGSLFSFVIVATNPRHMLFYSSYDFYRDRFGPLFYLVMIYQYSLILLSLTLFVKKIIFSSSTAFQERLIVLATLIPLGVNIAYLTDLINPMFDITPLAMTLVLGLFALAAFRYRFLGVIYLAERVIREGINDPIVIFDRKNVPLAYDSLNMNMAVNSSLSDISVGETLFCDDHYFRLQCREIRRGYTLEHWADVSHLRRLERDRKEAVDRLEKLGEEIEYGNTILLRKARQEAVRHAQRELHDTLGHSLTQIILLLRSVPILEKSDFKGAVKVLKKATALCSQSLDEMALIDSPLSSAHELLSISLYHMEEEFSDTLEIHIAIKGREIPISQRINHALLRCCQEAVTNGIKHGGADRIDMVIRYENRSLLLLIADNGEGCHSIVPGLGIKGMIERLAKIGGTMRYQGEKGRGVMLSIQVPLSPFDSL